MVAMGDADENIWEQWCPEGEMDKCKLAVTNMSDQVSSRVLKKFYLQFPCLTRECTGLIQSNRASHEYTELCS